MKAKRENLIVVIPAYEPPQNFIDYVSELSRSAKAVVVVNDGSNDSFNPIFERISKIDGAVVLGYGENRGKGFALKYAFSYCIDNFKSDDIIVTADCDGQHLYKDVLRVHRAAEEHRGALILGSRCFEGEGVPKKSKQGNRMIRRIFRFFYGIDLYDTQTGLRGFSVSACREFVKIRGKRFEYEMSMLIYAKKHGVDIFEIPIDTIYDSVDNHSTHYRPVRDSLKIFWVVIRNFGLYLFSGLISGAVDFGANFLFLLYVASYVFPEAYWINELGLTFNQLVSLKVAFAGVSARVLSSVVNFVINYKLVFCGASKASFIKYYVLWGCQLGASVGLTTLVTYLFSFGDNALWISLAKACIDLLLGILSYQIQNAWVFKRVKKGKFFGPSALFARFLVRTFTPKYRCNVLPYDEPVLYVARHLDMKGAAATLGFLKFHVHPMILSVFFTKKECYKQYAEYTFTARHGKPRKKFNLRAWLLSRLVPMGIKSTKGVPVYRDFTKMKRTFDIATDYLLKGESLIVYPDIEYTAGSDKVSEIYDGFLYLTETYRFKTGKSLRIVPIHVNEKNGTLDEQTSLYIENFRIDRKPTAERIKYAINGMTPPASEDN